MELPRLVPLVHKGMKLVVPDPVVVAGGSAALVELDEVVAFGFVVVDPGSPPEPVCTNAVSAGPQGAYPMTSQQRRGKAAEGTGTLLASGTVRCVRASGHWRRSVSFERSRCRNVNSYSHTLAPKMAHRNRNWKPS